MIITDGELESAFYDWLNHYTKRGDRYYSDTSEERIIELYWDIIVDRVLEGLPEMTDEENEEIVNRLSRMF